MAGEIAVPIQECRDLINETVTVMINDANVAEVSEIPFFYCERDTIIDFASVHWESVDIDSGTIRLVTGPAAVVGTTGNMVNASTINPDQVITNAAAGTLAAFTSHELTILTSANLVPAGNVIFVEFQGTTTDGWDWITIQIRIRTRLR